MIKNGNGKNGANGKVFFFKIGTCPICKKENVPLTEHHIFKKAVFGNNGRVVYGCRDCHDEVENFIRQMENTILRAFPSCYRRMNKIIWVDGRMPTEEEMFEIVLQGFKKINAKLVNPWLEERIKSKSFIVHKKPGKIEE